MSDNPVLEMLRAIRTKQEEHTDILREMQVRLGLMEESYALLSRRLDRVAERLERIESRLTSPKPQLPA